MLEMLKNEANKTYTENGAVTYRSTGSDCLDLFASIGGMRKADDDEIIRKFVRAYTEDPDSAMKLLFYARDIRGGLGERRVFRVILKWLADNLPQTVIKNIEYIAEYGRYDDLLVLLGTKCEQKAIWVIRKQLAKDMSALAEDGEVSLLAKWLPSINASCKETVKAARHLAKALGMSEAFYRRTLSMLRAKIRIIENNLRKKQYDFDYSKQPSKAMFKYRQAFLRNDYERYRSYLDSVKKGTVKMNTSTLTPYDLIAPYLSRDHYYNGGSFLKELSEDEMEIINTTWNSFTDYGNDENMIAVIDTSGSMYWQSSPVPAAVALSLGLYIAERNNGAFANHFIEFSESPQLIELKGETFVDKLRYVTTFNTVADTNIEAVFRLILDAAVKNNVPQSELPTKIVIISDMEFNICVRNGDLTNFENAKRMYAEHGYKLPDIVFWNVASRNSQQPVQMNEQGVALISGCTPRIFEMTAGGILSPTVLMDEILGSDHYKPIAA